MRAKELKYHFYTFSPDKALVLRRQVQNPRIIYIHGGVLG